MNIFEDKSSFDLGEEFLAHYGVLGMHWGIRKDPNEKTWKQRHHEKRVAKYQGRVDALNTKLSEISAQKVRTPFGRARQNKAKSETRMELAQARKDLAKAEEGKLTEKQKKLVIGGAVTAALLAAVGVYQSTQSGEFHRFKERGKAFVTGTDPVDSLKRDDSLAAAKTAEEVARSVVPGCNPGYGAPGTVVNCKRSTFAYELRRRGYDVRASRTLSGRGQNGGGQANALNPGENLVPAGTVGTVQRLIRDLRKESAGKTPSALRRELDFGGSAMGRNAIEAASNGGDVGRSVFNALLTQPSGSRGELAVKYRVGGGHSIAWELFDGVPVIFDTQTGKTYRTPDDFNRDFGLSVAAAAFTRLDNLDLNMDFLLRWVRNSR